MLILSGATPLAKGQHRAVYQHPRHADWLVKVLLATELESWRRLPCWQRLARVGPYRGHLRELKEYIASRHTADGPSPICRVVGVVDTDLGLGLMLEKVRGADGGLAPTLAEWLRRDGLSAAVRGHLDTFHAAILRHNVIVSDLHTRNLVYGNDAWGGPRLVMIDGFGEKNTIPHCSMSRRHNRSRTEHKFRRLMQQVANETARWAAVKASPATSHGS